MLSYIYVYAGACVFNSFVPRHNLSHILSPLQGLFTIGAAINTGIVLGSCAMFMGILQLIFLTFGQKNGPFTLAGDTLPQVATLIVPQIAAVASLGVVGVGVICIVAVGETGTGVVGLKWCEGAGKACWMASGTSSYALGSYGASLVVLGLFACAVDMKLVQTSEILQNWNALGPLYIVMGALTLGAVGNTGAFDEYKEQRWKDGGGSFPPPL